MYLSQTRTSCSDSRGRPFLYFCSIPDNHSRTPVSFHPVKTPVGLGWSMSGTYPLEIRPLPVPPHRNSHSRDTKGPTVETIPFRFGTLRGRRRVHTRGTRGHVLSGCGSLPVSGESETSRDPSYHSGVPSPRTLHSDPYAGRRGHIRGSVTTQSVCPTTHVLP